METMAVELPKVGGVFQQMEDELGSVACAIGASITGTKAMTASSGPGFTLKQENIGLAYEAEIPLVVVDVMRGGPSTGLPTQASQQDVMQARWGTHGDHGTIALAPSSVPECYELAVKAFNLAERFRQPVTKMISQCSGDTSFISDAWCVAVSDHYDTDIAGALHAGIDAILFNRWQIDVNSLDPQPQYAVNHLSEIKDILL